MTETLTYMPTIATQKTITPRTKSIAFGNGYLQITGDGINNLLESWNLVFTVADTAKQAIEDFFIATNGYNYFNWTSPEAGATQKQYLVTNWIIQPLSSDNYNITATFKEWAGLT